MKRSLSIIAAVLVLLAAVLGAPAAVQADSAVQVSVTAAGLNLRAGPGTNYAVLNVLHSGDAVQATGRDSAGQWYQVQLSDGSTGWVSGAYVQPAGDTSGLAVVAAPPAPALTTAQAAGPARSGASTLVFQTSSGGGIYVVTLDSQDNVVSGPRYLTDGIDPALSPDGRTIAFTRWDNGPGIGALGSVWLINVDGSGLRKLNDFVPLPKSPTWSPDGTQIAIGTQMGGTTTDTQRCGTFRGQQFCRTIPAKPGWTVRTINVTTGAYQDQPGGEQTFAPTWDPADPNRIVFITTRGLANLNLAAQTVTTLTSDFDQRSPSFSPDGSKLVVSYHQNGHWDVHVLNADGSGEVRLTQTPETLLVNQLLAGQPQVVWNNAAPAWSPDGSQIAFLTDRSGQWEIWVMNADGSNQRPLLGANALGGLQFRYDGVDERMLTWR